MTELEKAIEKERKTTADVMYLKLNNIFCQLNEFEKEMEKMGWVEHEYLGKSEGAKNWTALLDGKSKLGEISDFLSEMSK